MKKRTIILLIMVIVCVACGIYVGDYYHAQDEYIEAYTKSLEGTITVTELENGLVIMPKEETNTGFIFYPSGKVEYEAYLPLMIACANEGILCVLLEMPCNLAVLDMDAAKGIPEQFSEVENWYIGGYSLGGSMAASYVANNVEDYEGVILLGSYSTADITDLEVLSIYGSNDEVLNHEKYENYQKNLPTDFIEYEIEGGNHAYFGMYGEQDGDGMATITNIEQIEFTAERIGAFVQE